MKQSPQSPTRGPRSAQIAQLAVRFLAMVAAALVFSRCAHTQELRIAAAGGLQFVMPDLAAQFQKQTGTKLKVIYASSGNTFCPIRNAAPCDLFFSADLGYPQRLASAGLADPDTFFIQKIAIANPDHAPCGRAAVAASKNAGFYDRVQGQVVFGENISQAAQFVESRNAEAGIIALSVTLSPAMKNGRYWQIPGSLDHPSATLSAPAAPHHN